MSNGSPFDAAKLFSAKGLVCVVTGGGTGKHLLSMFHIYVVVHGDGILTHLQDLAS